MVLVTRPDLVLLTTLGFSTMAGAWKYGKSWSDERDGIEHTTVEVLRTLPELALGLAAAFLVAVLGAALAAVFLGAALVAVFLGAAFLAAVLGAACDEGYEQRAAKPNRDGNIPWRQGS